MLKRRRLLIGLAILATVAAGLYWARPWPGQRLRSENFSQLRVGLSQREVEDLLGGPPGNYGQDGGSAMMTLEGVLAPPGSVERIWSDDANRFEIYFDSRDRVVACHRRAGYQQSPPEGLFAKSRRLIGL